MYNDSSIAYPGFRFLWHMQARTDVVKATSASHYSKRAGSVTKTTLVVSVLLP